jgi:hypothetical protein
MGDQELGMATGCNGRFAEKTAKHSRGGSFPWRDEEIRQLFTDTPMELARYTRLLDLSDEPQEFSLEVQAAWD